MNHLYCNITTVKVLLSFQMEFLVEAPHPSIFLYEAFVQQMKRKLFSLSSLTEFHSALLLSKLTFWWRRYKVLL